MDDDKGAANDQSTATSDHNISHFSTTLADAAKYSATNGISSALVEAAKFSSASRFSTALQDASRIDDRFSSALVEAAKFSSASRFSTALQDAGRIDDRFSSALVEAAKFSSASRFSTALQDAGRIDDRFSSALVEAAKFSSASRFSTALQDAGRIDDRFSSALVEAAKFSSASRFSTALQDAGRIDANAWKTALLSAERISWEDPALIEELNEFFTVVPEAAVLLANSSDALALAVPFGHDQAVRTTLQLMIVTALFSTLFVAFLVNPFLGAALSAVGTPNAVVTWKATGNAYDRLYGRQSKASRGAIEQKRYPGRRRPKGQHASRW